MLLLVIEAEFEQVRLIDGMMTDRHAPAATAMRRHGTAVTCHAISGLSG